MDPNEPPRYPEELRALRALQSLSRDVALVIDRTSMRIVDVNPEGCRLLGRPHHALLGCPVDEVLPGTAAEQFAVDARRGQSEPVQTRLTLRAADGRDIPALARAQSLATAGGTLLVIVAGELGGESGQTSGLAGGLDPLTGVPNRERWMRGVQQALAEADRHPQRLLAVLFIDLDGFKVVNDRLGHLEGDRLLRETAQRLASSVRPDDLVARFGGDEFVVLLEGVRSQTDALAVARRIGAQLERPLELPGPALRISASIGVAMCWPGAAPQDLLLAADQAMYRAKSAGPGQCAAWQRSP